MTHDIKTLVGMRVLVAVGDNDAPRETAIDAISPNGLYVRLLSEAASADGGSLGWQPINRVAVLDVLGPERYWKA